MAGNVSNAGTWQACRHFKHRALYGTQAFVFKRDSLIFVFFLPFRSLMIHSFFGSPPKWRLPPSFLSRAGWAPLLSVALFSACAGSDAFSFRSLLLASALINGAWEWWCHHFVLGVCLFLFEDTSWGDSLVRLACNRLNMTQRELKDLASTKKAWFKNRIRK